ncbi:MAG TPA: glycosyltransferase family 4 protein [Acidimicrobiales bacterium]|nr:glycosyltransferase family 4 protein [Acidimicrobiales bacterium]
MRILHTVEFYEPSRGGAQEVVRRLSEAIARRGHEVTVATAKLPGRDFNELNGVRIVEFDLSGNTVDGVRGNSWAYQRYLTTSDFDVVMAYAAQQWATDLLLDCADDIRGARVCAPCGYSGLHWPRFARYFESLPAKLGKLEATVYHSPSYQDIELARAHGLGDLHVIPNGAAEADFGDLGRGRSSGTELRKRYGIDGMLVLTVGSHTGLKGHRQAMATFAAAPIGPSTLVVIGNGRPGEGCYDSCHAWAKRLNVGLRATGKRVLVLDLPREDVVAAFWAADIFLFLSVIECSPIVLFESAASGTAFIASEVGNAAEIAQWTGAGEVVPNLCVRHGSRIAHPVRAVAALARLAREPRRREKMAEAGRQAWQERYRWELIADRYLALYEDVVARRRGDGYVAARPGAVR